MITDAANTFADELLAKSKQHDDMAKYAACEYARDDNKSSKESYQKNAEMSEFYRKLHGQFCQISHAIESEMTTRLNERKEQK